MGARVAVVDLREEGVAPVVEEIRGAGGEAEGHAVDVADAEAVIRLVDDVVARFGGLDILVNNAGISMPGPVYHVDVVR